MTSPFGKASVVPVRRDSARPTVPLASSRTRTRYSPAPFTRRPVRYTYVPLPVGAADSENDVRSSESVCDRFRYAVVFTLAVGRPSVATPEFTDCRLLPAEATHAPPASAVPRPLDAVRWNVSWANTAGPSVTVTACVLVAVPPRLSVTVRL